MTCRVCGRGDVSLSPPPFKGKIERWNSTVLKCDKLMLYMKAAGALSAEAMSCFCLSFCMQTELLMQVRKHRWRVQPHKWLSWRVIKNLRSGWPGHSWVSFRKVSRKAFWKACGAANYDSEHARETATCGPMQKRSCERLQGSLWWWWWAIYIFLRVHSWAPHLLAAAPDRDCCLVIQLMTLTSMLPLSQGVLRHHRWLHPICCRGRCVKAVQYSVKRSLWSNWQAIDKAVHLFVVFRFCCNCHM